MIWFVLWVIFMVFWLFGGGYYVYNSPTPNHIVFGTGTLIPWFCVLILGLVIFGVVTPGPIH